MFASLRRRAVVDSLYHRLAPSSSTTTTTTTTSCLLFSLRSSCTMSSSSSSNNSSSNTTVPPVYPVVAKKDFGPFKEYSVIHTDRSLNLMSAPFGSIMRDLNALLKHTYHASKVAIIPGSGTFGMEAVARQFAEAQHVMVLRNGWFSYRWTEILELGRICRSHTVLKAEPVVSNNHHHNSTSPTTLVQYRPAALERVLEKIKEERPAVFFCPHVETSTGMILPDTYIREIANAVHAVDGILVLDCIASGTVWVDMEITGVDVLISAPQKGWTGPPCAALVMLSERAADRMNNMAESSSFSLSMKRWCAIMDAYEKGGFAYHTTMPTDALRDFHEISVETLQLGLPQLKEAQIHLGAQARALLDDRYHLHSVAAPGFQAPGVLVYYSPADTPNPVMMAAFKARGLQIAMGVPWKIDEPAGLKTFRIGLFGLDKLTNIPQTLLTLVQALEHVMEEYAPEPAQSRL